MIRQDIIKMINTQREFFNKGQTRDLDFRLRQLKKLKDVINKYEGSIIESLKKDLGKSLFDSYTTEIGFVISDIDFMVKKLRSFASPQKVKTPMLYFGATSYIVPEPLGNVLIIGPWNYPFQLILSPLVGAIAAGNCVVLKPSEYAPNTSSIVGMVIKEAFKDEYVSVIKGGAEEASVLLEQKFDHIFFTGGTSIGRKVMEAAAKHLTPVTLELGGKSPCIVHEDTNIENAARRIAWGKYLNAGQTCVAPDYLLIHKNIKTRLIENIKKSVTEFYGEEPKGSEYYGRIINEKHFDRLIKLFKQGDVVLGGKSDRSISYISPTIMDSVQMDGPIMKDEIFGPILPLIEYKDIEEVIAFINDRPKPLALYLFSNYKKVQDTVIAQTTSGGACINDTISHITSKYLPFGGVGESGMGNYHGKASFDTFSHLKSVLRNQLAVDIKLKYPPYSYSLEQIKKMMKLI